jgi:hypothetical protein
MGFLDGLFGGEKKRTLVASGELDSWLKSEISSESSGVIAKATPIVDSIEKIIQRLKVGIGALDAAGFNDIDPRFDKIVRTAKPGFVRSMRLALEAPKLQRSDFSGLSDYDKQLATCLDAIGKASIGDGKFLQYAFQQEMIRVQADCRRLLDAREELSRTLTSNKRLAGLEIAVSGRARYIETQKKTKIIKEELTAILEAQAKDEQSLAALSLQLQKLESSAEFARISAHKERLTVMEHEISRTESEIHQSLGPLQSAFRRYEKVVADPSLAKLAKSLEHAPVETFLNATASEIDAVLEGLAKNLGNGSLAMKDADKVIKKVEVARSQLTEEFRLRHKRLAEDAIRLRHSMDLLPQAKEKDRLLHEINALRHSQDKQKADVIASHEKILQSDAETRLLLQSLRQALADVDVDLE